MTKVAEVNENSSTLRIENTKETKCSNCCKIAKAVGMIAAIVLTSVGVLGSFFFFSSNKFTDILKNLALRITGKNISDALASRIKMISTFVIPFLILVLGGGAFGVLFASSRCDKGEEEMERERRSDLLEVDSSDSSKSSEVSDVEEEEGEEDLSLSEDSSLRNLQKEVEREKDRNIEEERRMRVKERLNRIEDFSHIEDIPISADAFLEIFRRTPQELFGEGFGDREYMSLNEQQKTEVYERNLLAYLKARFRKNAEKRRGFACWAFLELQGREEIEEGLLCLVTLAVFLTFFLKGENAKFEDVEKNGRRLMHHVRKQGGLKKEGEEDEEIDWRITMQAMQKLLKRNTEEGTIENEE